MLAGGNCIIQVKSPVKVTNAKKMNLKSLTQDDLPYSHYPLLVMDLSFISLRKVLRQAWGFRENQGRLAFGQTSV